MKKILAFALFVALLLTFCGCSNSKEKLNSSSNITIGEISEDNIENNSSNTNSKPNYNINTNSNSVSDNVSNQKDETKKETAENNGDSVDKSPSLENGPSNSTSSNSNKNPDSSSNASDNTSSENKPIVDMENLSSEIIEKFSEEQIKWVHENAEKFPKKFVFSELEGYKRVLSSASSADEALKIVENKFTTPTYITTQSEVLVETDYFYGIYVRWEKRDNKSVNNYFEEKVVCFKKNICDYQNVSSTKDIEEGTMISKDEGIIKQILDYGHYSYFNSLGGHKVLYSEINDDTDKYTHVAYYISTIYGAKDVMDQVVLYKQETVVNKETGEFKRNKKVEVKKIEVVGEAFGGGEGFVE